MWTKKNINAIRADTKWYATTHPQKYALVLETRTIPRGMVPGIKLYLAFYCTRLHFLFRKDE